eukprot:CAMPEP_0118875134 /NCGR_PEP_ID=MMETSP1163-20130328/16311_1 /TAXON_ID=124430 /ORGANISM="Phaeomonas parva, Strain CCMP2877" /LENGTH=51 /DNA_ID=CAMNT_0006810593 /DNA_START=452 /DNA_END=604 /DNA_ORIENTATION=+
MRPTFMSEPPLPPSAFALVDATRGFMRFSPPPPGAEPVFALPMEPRGTPAP